MGADPGPGAVLLGAVQPPGAVAGGRRQRRPRRPGRPHAPPAARCGRRPAQLVQDRERVDVTFAQPGQGQVRLGQVGQRRPSHAGPPVPGQRQVEPARRHGVGERLCCLFPGLRQVRSDCHASQLPDDQHLYPVDPDVDGPSSSPAPAAAPTTARPADHAQVREVRSGRAVAAKQEDVPGGPERRGGGGRRYGRDGRGWRAAGPAGPAADAHRLRSGRQGRGVPRRSRCPRSGSWMAHSATTSAATPATCCSWTRIGCCARSGSTTASPRPPVPAAAGRRRISRCAGTTPGISCRRWP